MPRLPKNIIKGFVFFVLPIYAVSLFSFPAYSDEISDIEKAIQEKNSLIEEKKSVLSTIESRIADISSSNYSVTQKINLINEEIAKLQGSIDSTSSEIAIKTKEIEDTQNDLEKKKELLDSVSGDLYVQSRYSVSNFFLSLSDWNGMIEKLFVKKNTISILKDEIERVSGEFSSLAEAKANLDVQKVALDTQKSDLDSSYSLLAAEKSRLQKELNSQYSTKSSLKAQIGGITKEISQLQQTLLYIKGGGTIENVDAVSSNATPTTQLRYFIDNAPAGTFGIFSYGTNTHRNGMSQWGAWERGQQGQAYTQILSAYYPNSKIRTGTVKTDKYGEEAITSNIIVDGYGTMNLETYLLGIREVDDTSMNTHNENYLNYLRAQVIAARTYAVNRTSNGRSSICTTTSCQVYSTDQLGGLWAQAVGETTGMTLANSEDYIFSSEFSAVTGGWINANSSLSSSGFYDVNTALSGTWQSKAWEALSGVNWFHMNWYQKKNTTSNKWETCSTEPNPWMTGEELADILNAYKYWMDSGTSSDTRLVSVDADTCWGGSSNPYSWNELKSLVTDPIKRVITAEAVEGSGWTTELKFSIELESGSITTFNITGTKYTLAFRDVYNMRAPGYFSIPQKPKYGEGFIHINIVKGVK